MIGPGAGGFVRITKNKTDQLASPYDVKEWKANVAYEMDDMVYIADSSGDNVEFARAEVDHTSDGTDYTGQSASDAGTLDADKWETLLVGELFSLSSWVHTKPVTERSRRLLKELAPRVTYGRAAETLQLNFLDNFRGSPLQRVLAEPNQRVYVRLYPEGEGAGKELTEGMMRVGAATHDSGDGDTDRSRTVTLAADGGLTTSVQT